MADPPTIIAGMARKSTVAKAKCALCGAKEVSEPRGEERYCRDCWEKKIAVEEIVAREFALKRYIRAHSAEKYLVYHSTIKRPCGQIIVVDDGYDLFLSMILYPNFGWDEAAYHLEGDPEGRTFAEILVDVVATEVKKLGGALFIESTPGAGTTFTVRLPFTLAISQSLIVRVVDELYALPLPTVEGIVRLSSQQVAQHLAEEAPSFDYGGQKYRFQHLGAFLGSAPALLPEGDASVSVILVRAGEHSTALVADELVGSREIVVKSLGPQISSIRGISGATILGDGRIVIILDVGALVRSEWRHKPAAEVRAPLAPPQADRRVFALVVDDSITVRRVTQRLLERNGMRVVTAKDGLEAVSVLQDAIPDVILLDIEMPRMDGYEVASHVRNDARLKDVPIVMITSRVGEKHRARAIELGVNEYLGKPYQEGQLLQAIEPLVRKAGT